MLSDAPEPTTPGTGQAGRAVSTDSRRRRNPTRSPRPGRCPAGWRGQPPPGSRGLPRVCAEGQAAYRPSSPRQGGRDLETWAEALSEIPRRHGVEAGTRPTSSTFLLLHLFYRWVSAKKKTLGLESSKRGVPEFMKIAPGRRGVARVAQEPAEPNPAGLPGSSRSGATKINLLPLAALV